MTPDQKKQEPGSPVPLESERSRFALFAEKLVNVPKEIDGKAREWECRPDRPCRPKSDKAG